MQTMIGGRFLKRFLRNRPYRHETDPASDAMDLPAYDSDEPGEPGEITNGNPPDTEAMLEKAQTVELNQPADPENRLDLLTTDDEPLTADSYCK